MSAGTKFYQFVEDLAKQVHNLDADTLRVLLTNDTPSLSDTLVDTTTTPCTIGPVSNAQEVAAVNGYTKKGNVAAFISGAQVAGVYKLVLSSPASWTPGAGPIGPLRYAVLFNDSAKTPSTRPVIGFWDYGSSITPSPPGDTFTATLDPTGAVTIQ